MGKWFRVDALFRQHPKFVSAGRRGTEATQAAWEIAKAFDCADGDVTQYWTPAYLARWLNAADSDRDEISAGMAAAEEANLIERRESRVLIHDWRDHQPESSTERVRKHRERKKRQKHDETVSPVSGNGETTNRTGQDQQDGTGRDATSTAPARAIPGSGDNGASTDSTLQSEARALEQLRTSVPCLQCGKQWRLIRGRDGDFYGHGRNGSPTGCRATCPAEEYQEHATASEPGKLCSTCGKFVCLDDKDICAPCSVTGGNHGC